MQGRTGIDIGVPGNSSSRINSDNIIIRHKIFNLITRVETYLAPRRGRGSPAAAAVVGPGPLLAVVVRALLLWLLPRHHRHGGFLLLLEPADQLLVALVVVQDLVQGN